jgi:O-antigen/teichoic acid export membrane protein
MTIENTAIETTEPHKSGLRQRLMRGLGASALGPIVTAIIQLGSVPILLHVWGVARYGDWLLLSAIPSYLTLTDLGFGDASGSEMSMSVAANDRNRALETFQSSWALVSAVSFMILFLASLVAWNIPWQKWLHLSTISSPQAAAVIVALAAYVVVAQQNGIAESGFRAGGNFATGTFWLMILRLSEVTGATIIALRGGTLLAVACTYLIIRVIGTIAYIILLRRLSPWIRYGIRQARLGTIQRLAAPAFGFMAFPIAYAINLQGFTLLIGAMLGPVAVVSFATLRSLSRVSFQIIGVIKVAIWPELSRAFGEGKVSLARQLHRHACQASLGLSVGGGVLLALVGPYIYETWIRHRVPFNAPCFYILLAVVVTNSLWDTSSVIPMSVNGHCRIAVLYIGAGLLSLILARIMVPHLGIVGAAAALLASDALMTGYVVRTALRHVEDNAQGFVTALCSIPRFRQFLTVSPDA